MFFSVKNLLGAKKQTQIATFIFIVISQYFLKLLLNTQWK